MKTSSWSWVKKAYDRASENVRLVGTGLYDKNERQRRLLSVYVIYSEGGATQPFESRLEEIRATPAGWHDDENPAPSAAANDAMRRFLADASMQPVPLPHLYPLPNGGIAAEWTVAAWEASAEVDAAGLQVTLNAVNTDTVHELDAVIDLQSPELMSQFMMFMSAMSMDEEAPDASQRRVPAPGKRRTADAADSSESNDRAPSGGEVVHAHGQGRRLPVRRPGNLAAVSRGLRAVGLASYADPLSDNSAHALVAFAAVGGAKKQQTAGKVVYAKAKTRGRLYPPPDEA